MEEGRYAGCCHLTADLQRNSFTVAERARLVGNAVFDIDRQLAAHDPSSDPLKNLCARFVPP